MNLTGVGLSLHAKRPRVLYHYTDAAGLLGMLKSQRVWATNTRFLNDPTEGDYAAAVVREVLQEQKSHLCSISLQLCVSRDR